MQTIQKAAGFQWGDLGVGTGCGCPASVLGTLESWRVSCQCFHVAGGSESGRDLSTGCAPWGRNLGRPPDDDGRGAVGDCCEALSFSFAFASDNQETYGNSMSLFPLWNEGVELGQNSHV